MMTRISVGPFFVREDQFNILKDRTIKHAGIYRIINANNGKGYVGSTRDLNHRLISHGSLLMSGKHGNKHLQNSFNKHGGAGMFAFLIEEECDPSELLIAENRYIRQYQAMDGNRGYNMQMGIRDDSSARWSQEVLNKISVSNKENFKKNPERGKVASARLQKYHRENRFIAHKCLIKPNRFKHPDGRIFFGGAGEMIRSFPEDRLNQSALWRLANGLAHTHKGWTIVKQC